jgi:PAS domain S-box-containing protein
MLHHNYKFLEGSGEMATLIREHDWSQTSIGTPDKWPVSLLTTIGIVLNSRFPMFMYWGSELVCFYNDAYRPSLGVNGKHPQFLGQPAKVFWSDIWHVLEPLIQQVLSGGGATWHEDQLIPFYRNGTTEDIYWTFSYSPVLDETGNPGGIIVACTETTEKVLGLNQIRESKQELEFAIDAAELGTWDLNPYNNKFIGNNRLKSWFGIKPEAEIDLSLALNVIADKDRYRVASAIEEALQPSSGGKYDTEYTIIHPETKTERIVRAKGKALFDENGTAVRLNGTLQDITEEVVARIELTRSEQQFRALILQAPVAIAVFKGPHFVVEVANEPMYQLWGRGRDQIMGKPIFESLPEAQGQGLEILLENVYLKGERFEAREHLVMLPRNGKVEVTYINFVYEPLRDNNGITGVIGVASEVTEQVIAKRKIEDAEERARLALDAAEMGSFDYNLVTKQIIGSDRLNAIFGLQGVPEHEDYLRKLKADDQHVRLRAFEEALKTGHLYYESRLIWDDGSVRWIQTEGKVYFDEDNKPVRLLGTVLDVTQEKEYSEELLKINQRLEIALEAGRLGSYELVIDTGLMTCTAQFKANYGLNNEAGFEFEDLIALILPQYRDGVKQKMDDAITNHNVYNIEYQVQWPDGSTHWINASGKARYDEVGRATIMVGVTFDITEQKLLQQQKDEFIGIASHELKTPVTSIKAYTQVLERMLTQKGDTREAAMIGKMDAQLNRLTSLIADLLDVTKINSGRLQFNYTWFDFNQLIAEVVEDLQRTTQKHTLIEDMQQTGKVYADRERVSQVLVNLITNAIKYSPHTKEIIISTRKENDEVLVGVQDFGIGISKEKQERVFEQFYRVSGVKQHTFPGLGLGLYISSEIIKREGGRIWVNSAEGKGSTFYFALPVQKS